MRSSTCCHLSYRREKRLLFPPLIHGKSWKCSILYWRTYSDLGTSTWGVDPGSICPQWVSFFISLFCSVVLHQQLPSFLSVLLTSHRDCATKNLRCYWKGLPKRSHPSHASWSDNDRLCSVRTWMGHFAAEAKIEPQVPASWGTIRKT